MESYFQQTIESPSYAAPTFQELLALCHDFGLVAECAASPLGVRLVVINQVFEISLPEAQLLLQGLLLGYFFGHSGDDLSLAQWDS